MKKMDKYDRNHHFQIINNQVTGHCFKYLKEITRKNFFYNRIFNITALKQGIDHWLISCHSVSDNTHTGLG